MSSVETIEKIDRTEAAVKVTVYGNHIVYSEGNAVRTIDTGVARQFLNPDQVDQLAALITDMAGVREIEGVLRDVRFAESAAPAEAYLAMQ